MVSTHPFSSTVRLLTYQRQNNAQMTFNHLPGERRLYESAGGLSSSRVALQLVSIVPGRIFEIRDIRIGVHGCAPMI